ncbi:MAG: hypothetical protein IPM52_13310 [Bacteroidetes bacterium]|nr:hypothetical protein [Bacteroidota bacterium]
MEQLTETHAAKWKAESLMVLLGSKIELELSRDETETLKNMLAMWVFSGIEHADDLAGKAHLQQCLRIVEKKLRPGLLKVSRKQKIKLDLMQAHCLMQALDEMMFLPAASFELNTARRVINQIDRQT